MENDYSWKLVKLGKVSDISCIESGQARQKRRCANDPCLFKLYLFWINKVHLSCLLKHKINAKKVPKQSALYKQALFSFPSLFLFCYSRAVFTRVPFFDRKAKGVKELDRFCLRWKWCSIGVSGMSQNVPLSFVEGLRRQLLWVSWCRCRKGSPQPVSPCRKRGPQPVSPYHTGLNWPPTATLEGYASRVT